jgi:hypothetical protein
VYVKSADSEFSCDYLPTNYQHLLTSSTDAYNFTPVYVFTQLACQNHRLSGRIQALGLLVFVGHSAVNSTTIREEYRGVGARNDCAARRVAQRVGEAPTMKAMLLRAITSLLENDHPLELTEVPRPDPSPGEVLIRVSACGVCHTELDEIEGRTAPSRFPIILGHEVGHAIARHAGERVVRAVERHSADDASYPHDAIS